MDPTNKIDPSGMMISLSEVTLTSVLQSIVNGIARVQWAILGPILIFVANNTVLLQNVLTYSMYTYMASSIYVSLEDQGVVPESPSINGHRITQYIQEFSGITFLLTCAISSMVPPPSGQTAAELIKGRTDQLRSQIGRSHGFGTTLAVGVAETRGGGRVVLVSSNEGYLRSNATLNPGEVFVRGSNHAEVNIVEYCNQNQLKLVAIGASRPVCNNCVNVISPTGSDISTPTK